MKVKFLIIILVIGNILLLNKIITMNVSNLKSETVDLIPLKVSLKESFSTNGKIIPSLYLNKLKRDSIDISKYIKGKKTIIFVYSEVSCNSCVDTLIYRCNNLAENLKEKYDIVGIAFSENINYLRRFVRINKFNFPVFWDKDQKFIKKMELNLLPAILIVDEDAKIINSFFINPNIYDFNSLFFNALTN